MREQSLFQLLIRNLGWLLASLLLAMTIWVAAKMSNNPVEQRELTRIPIDYTVPDGYVLVDQATTNASIVVRTEQSEWDLLTTDDITISADLSQVNQPGEYRIELNGKITSPRHGSVVAIRPSTLSVVVDREAEKRVPVEAVIVREPPLGYSSTVESCSPSEITVRGSAEKVDSVVRAEVRLSLSDDLNPTTKLNQPLIAVNEDNREVTGNITLEPSNVSCSVDIQVREDVIQMRVLPNVIGAPPSGYLFAGYASVNPETVAVTGDRQAIDEMNYVARTEPIDLSTRTGTFSVQVPLDLPDGVSLVPEDQLIDITVIITSSLSSRQIEDVPVEVTGIDMSRYRVTGLPSVVTVVAVGPQDQLPEREDLRVTVDLSNMDPGNHQVVPEAVLTGPLNADGLSLSVLPEELSVTIEAAQPTPTPSPTPSTTAPRPTPTATPLATDVTGSATPILVD
ncbi:MAG TPA: CdaR family protein [Aggregatilinea sp.]|jgi:YbbR domain-containing protein|uniref:CdaR family protein n=1 Tax=Aggregatilinea sp. TaxID=2806333 RepID=UPI002C511578|nr:CdaR family protein [Aggregatilinea sp.]HML23370.1 CdaR family protein [Aggregatilinea sp.]